MPGIMLSFFSCIESYKSSYDLETLGVMLNPSEMRKMKEKNFTYIIDVFTLFTDYIII
jgi:hypothetical protein